MHGYFNNLIKTFVRQKFGDPQWDAIILQCRCAQSYKEDEQYDDRVTQALLLAAGLVLGLPQSTFLEALGEHYLENLRSMGYDDVLRNLGDSMLTFLDNLDYLHTRILSQYPGVKMPSFRCQQGSTEDKITLNYYSSQRGLYPIVMGLLKAVARTYYKSALTIEKVSQNIEKTSQRTESSVEHVVFSLAVTKLPIGPDGLPPPTFIAQTRKHAEKQIHQEDIVHVLEKLEAIKREQGPDALPLNRSKAISAKWKTVAKMSMLYGGFTAQYPQQLVISPKTFCNVFPYHIVFDRDMVIKQIGVMVQQALPGIRNAGSRLPDFFGLAFPLGIDLDVKNIKTFINSPFVLKSKVSERKKSLKGQTDIDQLTLRGQMVVDDDRNHVIFLCSPLVRTLTELEQNKLHLSDIPLHDVTRDLLWLERITRKNAIAGNKNGEVGSDLYNFLPMHIAAALQAGYGTSAEEYRQATVLFCDIVDFSSIVAHAKPSEVINLLTVLEIKINAVCQDKSTYRVETIGDALMVVSGVADDNDCHADAIASTALTMMAAAKAVTSPQENSHITLRMGVHSGPVISGVIAERVPKWTVMGPAVILASRLESHGLPGKIQISTDTKDLLTRNLFNTTKRGKIIIRGFGKMKVFLLEENFANGHYPLTSGGSSIEVMNGTGISGMPSLATNQIHPV